MRVAETLPDGSVVVRTMQLHVPFDQSSEHNRHNLFTAIHPFATMGAFGAGAGRDDLDTTLARLFEDAQAAFDGRGSPARAQDVERLRRYTVTENKPDATECTVCMEPPSSGDSCVELPCGHRFHSDCIKPWFSAHDTCPTCRRSIAQPS